MLQRWCWLMLRAALLAGCLLLPLLPLVCLLLLAAWLWLLKAALLVDCCGLLRATAG